MPLMFDSSKSRAILIGIGTFLKDDDLNRREHVYKDISLLRDTLTDAQILGIHEKDIVSLVDSEGNTMIKERIAEVANTTEDTLILFYSGYLIERRGKLILSSPHTTINQCHINGIPLTEVIEIVNESQAKRVFLILDAEYRAAQTFGESIEVTSKTIDDLLPFGPKKTYVVSELGQNSSQKTIASGLTTLFQTGIDEEKEVLTIRDVKKFFKQDTSLQEVLFSTNESDDIPICLNKRFSVAKKLRIEIEEKFKSKQFEEALPLLKEGIELFEQDEEFNNMAAFIETLHQADQMFNNQSYDAAKNRYQAAFDIIEEDTAYKGIIKSLEKIANSQYDNEDFESSKHTYTELLKFDSTNDLYNDKVNYCDNELKFTSYIDLGDKAYFENKFTIAKEHYSKALEYRKDPVVLRRKEECEKFLSREEKLRAEIKAELEDEIKVTLDNKVQEELKNKEHEIEEKLRSKLETELSSALMPKAKDEVTQELETSIWQKTAIWNSIEGYQFYLSMFPNGHFVAKADQRMDQIHKQKLAQKMEEKEKTPAIKIVDTKESKEEELNIERALLMDLRMEPIEDVLAKIEESKGLKGEVLLWKDTERILLERNEDDNEYLEPLDDIIISELDGVMDEAIREVEEEGGMSFDTTDVKEVENDSLSLEEAKELTASALEQEEITESEITEEVVDTTQNVPTIVNTAVSNDNAALEQLSEEELWTRSEQINTKDAYLEYINYTKTADQIAEAYYRINKIDQGDTPEITASEPSIVSSSESNIIEEESISEVSIPAPVKDTSVIENTVFIDGMDEETLWKTASSLNTIDSYKEYLNRTESNDYLADAYSSINTIQNGETVTEIETTEVVEAESTSTFEIDSSTTDTNVIEEEVIDSIESSSVDSEKAEDEQPTINIENEINEIINEDDPNSVLNGFETPVETAISSELSSTPQIEVETLKEDASPLDILEDKVEVNDDEEDLWKNTCEENTLGAYFNYLNLTSQKKYWKEAKEKISSLKNDSQAKEEDDWKRAQEIDTIEGYKTYIRKYPLGNYYAAAMMRLGKLE